ncbi:MAG: efflux RND transporter periplasmic adaptor subunit [bacterium]
MLIAGMAFGCGKKTPPPQFTKVKVKRGEIMQQITAAGTIVPERQVAIQSERGGLVKAIHVNVGDAVKEGQLIIELRDEELKMQVMRAEAAVAEYRAMLQQLKDQPRKLDLITAQGRLDDARRKAEHARLTLDRMKTLHEQGYRSDALLEQSQLEFELAQQEYKSAQDYIAELKKGALKQELEAAQSKLENAQAELQISKESLSKSYIYAPISGTVIRRKIEVGDAISPGTSQGGTSMLEIADAGTLYFEGNLDETDAARARVGMPANIKVDALPDRKFKGDVIRIAPAAESGAQMNYMSNDKNVVFPVKVEITGDKKGLLTGMRADAGIEIKRHKNVLLVPLLSVKYENDKEGVYLPPKKKGKKAEKPRFVPIETGIDDGKFIIVKKGLKEGQEICENYTPAPPESAQGNK